MQTGPYSALIGMPFKKMNGIGNDFVVLDARERRIIVDGVVAKRIADRSTGIGCDQLVILEKAAAADVFMRIVNADGGEVEACGNATRCVARLLMQESGKAQATIETKAGLLRACDGGSWSEVAVDMGRPALGWAEIPLAEPCQDTSAVPLDTSALHAGLPGHFSAVNMGNPHAVFFVDDVEAHDLGRTGPLLEHHPIFPERANVSLVSISSSTRLVQKVWERGAGLTLACGTGACAAVVAAARAGLAGREVTVTLPGGDLFIHWRADDHVIMRGKVELEFEATLTAELFGASRREVA